MRVSGDPSRLGVEGSLFHLECGEISMVIDAALGEQGDILETVVVLDNMVEVGVTFTADVLEGIDVEAELGRVLRAAFGIDLAVLDDCFEPAKILAIVRDDNLQVQRIPRNRGGVTPG